MKLKLLLIVVTMIYSTNASISYFRSLFTRRSSTTTTTTAPPLIYYYPIGSDDLPKEVIELAKQKFKLSEDDLKNLPKLNELTSVLGMSSNDETVEFIVELLSTEDGIKLIESFLTSNNEILDDNDNDNEIKTNQIEMRTLTGLRSNNQQPEGMVAPDKFQLYYDRAKVDVDIMKNVLTTARPEISLLGRLSAWASIFAGPNNEPIAYSPLNKNLQQLDSVAGPFLTNENNVLQNFGYSRNTDKLDDGEYLNNAASVTILKAVLPDEIVQDQVKNFDQPEKNETISTKLLVSNDTIINFLIDNQKELTEKTTSSPITTTVIPDVGIESATNTPKIETKIEQTTELKSESTLKPEIKPFYKNIKSFEPIFENEVQHELQSDEVETGLKAGIETPTTGSISTDFSLKVSTSTSMPINDMKWQRASGFESYATGKIHRANPIAINLPTNLIVEN